MNRMKQLRQELNLNMRETARLLNIPYTTYVGYEKGTREPNSEMLITIADFFEVSIDYLLNRGNKRIVNNETNSLNDDTLRAENYKIPLLEETIYNNSFYENDDLKNSTENEIIIHSDFCLKVKDDSMVNSRIKNGDIVFIRKQSTVNNGEVAAVLIENKIALKRVYYDKKSKKIILQAENPNYPPVYTDEEMAQIRIIGKAIAFQSYIT